LYDHKLKFTWMLLNCTFKLYLKTSFFFVKNVENSKKLLFFLQFTKKFNVQCKFYQPSASSTKNFRDMHGISERKRWFLCWTVLLIINATYWFNTKWFCDSISRVLQYLIRIVLIWHFMRQFNKWQADDSLPLLRAADYIDSSLNRFIESFDSHLPSTIPNSSSSGRSDDFPSSHPLFMVIVVIRTIMPRPHDWILDWILFAWPSRVLNHILVSEADTSWS